MIVPLELKQNVLKVAMANPDDRETIDALRVATAAEILVYTIDRKTLGEYISRFYDKNHRI